MFSVTYKCPRSNNGIGVSYVHDMEDMERRIASRYEVISIGEDEPTPAWFAPVDNCIYQGRAAYGHTFPGFCTADACY